MESLPQDVLDFQPHLADPDTSFDSLGASIKEQMVAALPGNWTFEGKRVLDFGCGCGRVLRHFAEEAWAAEFWGCDIDEPSIEWLRSELCPPFRVLTNGERPPIRLDDDQFDLIYAISVFTHLTDQWAPWLLEMRRLLKPGGLLLASTHGAGTAFRFDEVDWHEPWDEDRIGMHVAGFGSPWAEGGPSVTHSQWWLRGHWGRALEITKIAPGPTGGGHDFVLAQRDQRSAPSSDELERPIANEPREWEAIRYSLRQAHAEAAALRRQVAVLRQRVAMTNPSRLKVALYRAKARLLRRAR